MGFSLDVDATMEIQVVLKTQENRNFVAYEYTNLEDDRVLSIVDPVAPGSNDEFASGSGTGRQKEPSL